jgi:hypothetical protein
MTAADARECYGDELTERALSRSLSLTQYGWRVAYDVAMDGKYEMKVSDGKPRAYWPKSDGSGGWWCRCRWGRTGRMCSHVLAVILKLEGEMEGNEDGDNMGRRSGGRGR